MPLNDSDPGTCWAVKTPILYGLTSYGHLNASKGEQVQVGPPHIACSVSCVLLAHKLTPCVACAHHPGC